MKRIIYSFTLLQLCCATIGNGQTNANNIDSLVIYSLPWDLTTPVGLDSEQFLNFPATQKKTIENCDTIKLFNKELQNLLIKQSDDIREPDIRIACFVYLQEGKIEKYYFNRQKFLFYNGYKYDRNIDLINLLEAIK